MNLSGKRTSWLVIAVFVLGVGALFSLVSGSESVGAARRRIVRAKALFGRGKVKAKLREHFLERHVSAENIDVALAKVRKLSKASAVPPLQIVLEVVEPVRRLYPTNTGHWLSTEEAAELIDPEDSYLAIHHPVSLEVLAFGRTRHLASQFQRLALWLEHPGVHVPRV